MCYSIRVSPKTWLQSRDDCEERDSELIKLTNNQELSYVYNTFIRPLHGRSAWIGLRKAGDHFEWVDGSRLTYKNWNEGEPNNYGGKEKCVELFVKSGEWNDIECTQLRPSLCKKGKTSYYTAVCTSSMSCSPIIKYNALLYYRTLVPHHDHHASTPALIGAAVLANVLTLATTDSFFYNNNPCSYRYCASHYPCSCLQVDYHVLFNFILTSTFFPGIDIKHPETLISTTLSNMNFSLKGFTIETITGLDVMGCATLCFAEPDCYSINFDSNLNKCELNNSTKATAGAGSFVFSPGYIYYD